MAEHWSDGIGLRRSQGEPSQIVYDAVCGGESEAHLGLEEHAGVLVEVAYEVGLTPEQLVHLLGPHMLVPKQLVPHLEYIPSSDHFNQTFKLLTYLHFTF